MLFGVCLFLSRHYDNKINLTSSFDLYIKYKYYIKKESKTLYYLSGTKIVSYIYIFHTFVLILLNIIYFKKIA